MVELALASSGGSGLGLGGISCTTGVNCVKAALDRIKYDFSFVSMASSKDKTVSQRTKWPPKGPLP